MIFLQNKRKSGASAFVRYTFFVFAFVGMLVSSAPRAQAWGDAVQAELMGQAMTKIYDAIRGAILVSLKMAAVQMLNSQVGQLVGGGSAGSALFITDFNDFLTTGPTQKANLYMNDFFTLSTRGKGTSSNYISAGTNKSVSDNYISMFREANRGATSIPTSGAPEGSSDYYASIFRDANRGALSAPVGATLNSVIDDNYVALLTATAKSVTTERKSMPEYTLEEYTSSPKQMFAEGDWRAFNAFFSTPANNPYGYALQAEQVYQSQLAAEQQAAAIKAQSSGFLPVEKNGSVVAPAGVIGSALAGAQDLPNKIIAAAKDPSELLGGVISAMANKMINNLIQRGVGQIQSNIQREIGNVTRETDKALGQATKDIGPAAQFMSSTAQRVNVNVKPSSAPLPFAPGGTSYQVK